MPGREIVEDRLEHVAADHRAVDEPGGGPDPRSVK
jgi:hypothetical protein